MAWSPMASSYSAAAARAVPSWSVYRADCGSGEEDAPRDSVLVGYVEHLGAALRGLGEEVRDIEGRQVTLDRRLAEFGGLLQGVQEEQLSRGGSLERSSQAATVGARRALHTAVAVQRHVEQEGELQACLDGFTDGLAKRLEQCCEQHGQWLRELSSEVAALAGGGRSGGASAKATGQRQGLYPPGYQPADPGLGARIAALEQGQKTVAVGARRALHTALVVHQQQQSQDHDNQWEKLQDSLPVADLELQFTRRITEQDTRLDKVVHMVDSLTDRVLMQQDLADGRSDSKGVRRLRERLEAIEVSVRDKVDEIESNIIGLASELEHHSPVLAEAQAAPEKLRELVSMTIESLEARMDRNLGEVSKKVDYLQDGREQQRLAMRQLGQQLPEVVHKLDQLWAQCQYYFPRVKEHDVHFGFFRTSFETHKQSWLNQSEGFDLREHRVAAASWQEPSPLSPPSVSSPPQFSARSPLRGPMLEPFGGAQAAASSSVAEVPSLFGGAGSAALPTRGVSVGMRAAADDDAELGTRQRMLQQVMARLHASDDGKAGP